MDHCAGTMNGASVLVKVFNIPPAKTDLHSNCSGDMSKLLAACSLKHPNIVATVSLQFSSSALESVGTCGLRSVRLVQEYCNGGTLQHAVHKGMFAGHKLWYSYAKAISVLKGVAKGMAVVHSAGITHGCLSCHSVLLQVRALYTLALGLLAGTVAMPSGGLEDCILLMQ
jgi:serine/threonine protein kinase